MELRALTYDELDEVIQQWNRQREYTQHDDWERMRTLATIVIQPHVKKRISPSQLMPFPWDVSRKKNTSIPVLSRQEHLKLINERFAGSHKRLQNDNNNR